LAIRRRLGVMPQDDALLEALTPRQYLELVGTLHGLARGESGRRRDELFELLDVAVPAKALLSELSYGTRKKVALAAALLGRPDLLFLDEPFEGIDPIASRAIRELVVELARRDVAVLLSSHQLGEVERLCSRVAILERGRLVACGTLDELRAAAPGAADLETLFESIVGRREPAKLSWL
jgi:ABC-2 type transport system ATP-binding protein